MDNPILISNEVLATLNGREKQLPDLCYKLGGEGIYGLDVLASDQDEVNENEMTIILPYADGHRRDGVGDLLEVGGIRTERHSRNPCVLLDHGKTVSLPIALTENPETREYTNYIDPIAQIARAKCWFYRGTGMKGIDRDKENEHALLCEQLFDLWAKRYIRSGSIGYRVLKAQHLQPDYDTGTPQGLHLLVTEMLECSPVVMPANADTVRKALCLGKCCGKPLSPMLVKSLQPYAPEKKVQLGYEPQLNGKEKSMPTETKANKPNALKDAARQAQAAGFHEWQDYSGRWEPLSSLGRSRWDWESVTFNQSDSTIVGISDEGTKFTWKLKRLEGETKGNSKLRNGQKISGWWSVVEDGSKQEYEFSGTVSGIHTDTAGGGFGDATINLDKPVGKDHRNRILIMVDGRGNVIEDNWLKLKQLEDKSQIPGDLDWLHEESTEAEHKSLGRVLFNTPDGKYEYKLDDLVELTNGQKVTAEEAAKLTRSRDFGIIYRGRNLTVLNSRVERGYQSGGVGNKSCHCGGSCAKCSGLKDLRSKYRKKDLVQTSGEMGFLADAGNATDLQGFAEISVSGEPERLLYIKDIRAKYRKSIPPAKWKPGVGAIKSQPSDKIPSSDACAMLKEGTAHEHKLTPAQEGMLGASCGRSKKSLDSTARAVLDGVLGAGKIDMNDYRDLERLGNLPAILRVLIHSGKLSKQEARTFARGEEEQMKCLRSMYKAVVNKIPNRYDAVTDPIQVGDKVIARQNNYDLKTNDYLWKAGDVLTVVGGSGDSWTVRGKDGKEAKGVGTSHFRKKTTAKPKPTSDRSSPYPTSGTCKQGQTAANTDCIPKEKALQGSKGQIGPINHGPQKGDEVTVDADGRKGRVLRLGSGGMAITVEFSDGKKETFLKSKVSKVPYKESSSSSGGTCKQGQTAANTDCTPAEKSSKAINNDQIAEMVRQRTAKEQQAKKEQQRKLEEQERQRRVTESILGRKVKSLPSIRLKHRKSAKGFRRRIKCGQPGISSLVIDSKDLNEVKSACGQRGLKFEHVGPSSFGEKVRLTGSDDAIDELAKQYGKPMKRVK